jgi:hypothetical protein
MVKVDEINLEMNECRNAAFNGNGRIAVVVEYNSQFAVLEVGRNETSQE